MAFDIKNLFHGPDSQDEPTREEVQHLEQSQTEQKPDHAHEWDLLSKTHILKRETINPTDFDKVDQSTMDKMLFGGTVFLWECLICKQLRKEDVLGGETTPLDEFIDKAALYGPQYYQKNGETFQIAKLINQPAKAPVLPMR